MWGKIVFSLLVVFFVIISSHLFSIADAIDDITAASKAQLEENYDEAIRLYTKAIKSEELKENLILGYVRRGSCYEAKGQLDRALEDYTSAIKLESNNSYHFTARGIIYMKKGFWDRAIEDFTEAISLNPSNINAYKQRAIAYEKKGMTENAKEDLRKVMQLGVESGGKASF